MLVVGSFWGRAGGLILVGLVAAIATAGRNAPAATSTTRTGSYAPTSAAEVEETYDFGGGRFTLDLSDVEDVEALDGRDVLDRRFRRRGRGRSSPTAWTSTCGPRSWRATSGSSTSGATASTSPSPGSLDGGDDVPDLSINIDLVAGEILVREAA